MLTLFFAICVTELLLFTVRPLWPLRKVIAAVLILPICFIVGAAVTTRFNALGILLGCVTIFHVLNLFRIVEGRMHSEYLRRSARRSSLYLMPLNLALFATHDAQIYLNGQIALQLLLAAQVVAAVIVALSALRNVYKTRFHESQEHYSDKELPTVSVLVPARNETTDLEACLRAIIANDYPKIEILVLDDCSQDATAEVIKKFAHDGVRFVQGHAPGERWLAKNQAYEQLYDESTGEFLLFCGVDVRLGTNAIRALVTAQKNRNKAMISVLPRRLDATPLSAIIQPIRYWWELALPRRLFNKPPVLSTCWLIQRKRLKQLGGFKAVSHAIIPEQYFARELIKEDNYSFIRANEVLDVQTLKSPIEQHNTAIRVRYPQLRRRPENALVIVGLELAVLLGPFIMLFTQPDKLLPAISCLLLIATHVLIVSVTNPANTVVAVFTLPVAIVVEIYNTLLSLVRYEFTAVEWKGRNICIPVMHVIPRLPALKD